MRIRVQRFKNGSYCVHFSKLIETEAEKKQAYAFMDSIAKKK